MDDDKIKRILTLIRKDPDSANPYWEAMNLVLKGDKSPELETIIRAGVKSGITHRGGYNDYFADFMARADDKTFKKYSYLLTPEVRERFRKHSPAAIKLKKFERTRKEIQADKKHDTFVFVGGYKFEKDDDGKYDKKFDIESLVKIDKYDAADLQSISMMKMRAHTREGHHLYIIKLPAGVIKDKVTHNLEPWLLKLIDEHKEKI